MADSARANNGRIVQGMKTMNTDEINYRDREHSRVKHIFLSQYLTEAAYKLFLGPAPVFNYIDAFAGPWKSKDTDTHSDTSFARAIESLEAVRNDIVSKLKRTGLRVRYHFCEKDPTAYAQLARYVDSHGKEFEINIFPGKFEDNLGKIQESCAADGRSFTFTFIDPTGWDIDNRPIFQFLNEMKGEFLVSFMSEPLNRHAGWDGVTESVGRFLADPNWRERYDSLSEELSVEERILQLFKCAAGESKAAAYLPDNIIVKPRNNRKIMRLILGTHNKHGVHVFRSVQKRVIEMAAKIKIDVDSIEKGIGGLFTREELAGLDIQKIAVGSNMNKMTATRLLLDMVEQSPSVEFEKAATCVMCLVAVRIEDMKQIAYDLRKRGKLDYTSMGRSRFPTEGTELRLVRPEEFGLKCL